MPRHELIKKLENKSEADVLAHVDAQPGDVAVKDDAGRLPLHVAVDNKASDAVVKKLLEAYPQAAAITTGYDKKLPLHLAVRSQPSEVVVQLLLDAYPEGAQALDEYKMLPLHLGVRYEASETVITMLLQAFPEGSKAGWTGDVRYYVRSTDTGPFEATVR